MSKVSIEHYGVQASGRNVTEAKQNAGRIIQRIIKNLLPKIYCRRGYSVVIYPSAGEDSAGYTIIHPDHEGPVYSSTCCGLDAEERAIAHLLQITRKIGEMGIPGWVPANMHQSLLADWTRDDAFQRAFKVALSRGEPNCHQWACEHQREFMA